MKSAVSRSELGILTEDKFVLVNFTQPSTCGPCRMMAPQLEKLDNEGFIEIVKVDFDESDPQLARDFAVRSIPTIVLLRDGQELYRTTGVKSADKLKAELEPFLA